MFNTNNLILIEKEFDGRYGTFEYRYEFASKLPLPDQIRNIVFETAKSAMEVLTSHQPDFGKKILVLKKVRFSGVPSLAFAWSDNSEVPATITGNFTTAKAALEAAARMNIERGNGLIHNLEKQKVDLIAQHQAQLASIDALLEVQNRAG